MSLPRTLNLDLEREARCGFPETVFGMGKTTEEVVAAARRLAEVHGRVLVTRASASALEALLAALPQGVARPRSGCFSLGEPAARLGPVALVSAGTSDEPVAEEAEATMRLRGVEVARFHDCGVAGLHRVLACLGAIRRCDCAVVVAGMDGALPTVLAGLVEMPVIACPTSVGYGVAGGGTAALHAMLASCAAGLTVVNIDNGSRRRPGGGNHRPCHPPGQAVGRTLSAAPAERRLSLRACAPSSC